MKFPRNAKTFKGELNAAPLVSVLFLLLVFVLMAGLVHTPGVSIRLEAAGEDGDTQATVVTVSGADTVRLADRDYSRETLGAFRDGLARLPVGGTVRVVPESGASDSLVREVRRIVREGGRIELPRLRGALAGTTNRTVAVAVDFSGQLYFRNQLVSEDQLRMALSEAVGARPDPLAIVVLADRAVNHATLMRLSILAREAGVKEMVMAARRRTFDSGVPR